MTKIEKKLYKILQENVATALKPYVKKTIIML